MRVAIYGFPSGSTQKTVPGYQDGRSVPGSSGTTWLGAWGQQGSPRVSTGCDIGAWWVSFQAQGRGGPAAVDVTSSQALTCGCSISSGREVETEEPELPRKQALRAHWFPLTLLPRPLENQKYLLAPKGLMIILKSPPLAQGLPGEQ